MNGAELPAWLEPVTLQGWPTQAVVSEPLHLALRLRVGWEAAPELTEAANTVEGVFRGGSDAEIFTAAYMPDADPQANLRDWVDATVALLGFPIPEMGGEEPPDLLEWEYAGGCPPLEARLALDECHLYTGLAWLEADLPEMARLYLVLARRGAQAWRLALAFVSACPPGSDVEMVRRNDHVRAGATLGYLELS